MSFTIEDLAKLEGMVDEELKIAEVYRHPITKESTSLIKKYFSDNREDIDVHIESSLVRSLVNLSQKYTAVFQKNRGN